MTPASPKYARFNSRFTHFQFRIGRSPIHRFGVFAKQDIPSRRKVIEYTGQRITQREALQRFEQIWRSRKLPKRIYLFRVSRSCVLDGAVGGSGAELINHSCEPNLRSRRIRGHILYFSRRKIVSGEELTVDYRFPKESQRVACRCGSHVCRGTINIR
jgi:uncharacterized protein